MLASDNESNESLIVPRLPQEITYTEKAFIIGISIPFIVCDLYYAATDVSCIHQKINEIHINMFVYLIVNAIGNIIICAISSAIIFTFDERTIQWLTFVTFFEIVWSVIGGVILWGYTDTDLCTDSVFNYLGIRLVVQYVFIGCWMLTLIR